MIWLIGNKGMLGKEVEALLKENKLVFIASDQDVDISNLDQLWRFSSGKSISWIINCAAYTAVDKAEDEPDLAFKINAVGPYNIAKVARAIGAKLIHISTDYVFDGTQIGAYIETDVPNPQCIYGKSKYQGEVYIEQTINKYFIIRTAWLYGKHGSNFVHTMLRLFRERDEISVVGDQYGTPTYAPDLAMVLLKIMQSNSDAYGIYHFTNEGQISWYDFACEIYRLVQNNIIKNKTIHIKKIQTKDYPTKAARPGNSLLSKKKIKDTFQISIPFWQKSLFDYIKTNV